MFALGMASHPAQNHQKMHQHYRNSNGAKFAISIVINYRDISQYRYYCSALVCGIIACSELVV